MYKKWVKHCLFVLILGSLFLPILQKKITLFKIDELGGAINKSAWEPFRLELFFSGAFQKSKEASIKSDFGFNQWFIRLNNQIQFDCFGKIHADGVIFGKKGFLFEKGYIDAALGNDFLGEDSIRLQVGKLKLVVDSLKNYGVEVVVLLAPGKGSFYPEYIPEDFKVVNRQLLNVDVYSSFLTNEGVLTFDVNKWFKELKGKSEGPLFGKTGIHWSYYAENLVTDSLLSFLSNYTGNQFPSRRRTGLFKSKIAHKRDGDVWEGMNLLRRFDELELVYPSFTRVQPLLNKTKVLTISDSFYWGMFYDDLSRDYFNNGRFWYYYKEVFPESYTVPTVVNDLDLKKELIANDVVLLICTDANMARFGFGFIDDAYALFRK